MTSLMPLTATEQRLIRDGLANGPDALLAAVVSIVLDREDRAWKAGWARGARDMRDSIHRGDTYCVRPDRRSAVSTERSDPITHDDPDQPGRAQPREGGTHV